jgi:PAS domain S-box-containing protein
MLPDSPPTVATLSSIRLIGLLHGLFAKLGQRGDLEGALSQILGELAEFLEADGGFLLSAVDLSNLRLLAESGVPFHEESMDKEQLHEFYNEIFREQRPTIIRSTHPEAKSPLLRPDGRSTRLSGVEDAMSLVGVPLVSDGRLIGGMCFYRSEKKGPFSYEDTPLLGIVALPMAIHLENLEYARSNAARRAELEAIVSSMLDGLLKVDSWGLIVSFNDAVRNLCGLPDAEFYTLYWDDILKTSDRHADLFNDFNRALREGKPFTARCPATIQQGDREIPVSVNFTTIVEASGRITGGVLSVRDVTIETQIDRMKDEFIATVSHELRTPITTISGFLEMMITRPMERMEQLPLLELIHSETGRLGRLINDMLDLSKIQSNRLSLDLKRFRMDALIKGCLKPFEMRHKSTHRFELSVAPARAMVHADPDRLSQVLVNFISNAVKYSPEGGTISLSAQRLDDCWRVEVHDVGIGIPDDALPHVFDRFYRVNENQTAGSGLGLYICKEIIHRHGGQIGARSEVGQGSTFWFTLPLQTKDAQAAKPAKQGSKALRNHAIRRTDS